MPWVWQFGAKGGSKGGGKGRGNGGGGKGRARPEALPEDFKLNEATVYTGSVITYYKFQGYGFIKPDQDGVIPGDKVFVFWKMLKSSDRYPSLNKDMQVQFTLGMVEKMGVKTLQAENVTLVGGGIISLQEELDAKKTFVGGPLLRYTGTLKFFLPKQGYGYIKIDPGYSYDKEGVPEEIRVEAAEMNCGGGNPAYSTDLKVEFGIWQTSKGFFKGFNVTLPGGAPLPEREDLPPGSAPAAEAAVAAPAPM